MNNVGRGSPRNIRKVDSSSRTGSLHSAPCSAMRRAGDSSIGRKQVEVILKEWTLFLHKMLDHRVFTCQRNDLDLTFPLIAHRPQAIGFLSVAGEFRIDQEQKAA